jgi:TonB family protein
MHTDWHTADGKHNYKGSGERLNFFEYKLQSALLSPLPDSGDLEPAKSRLDREDQKLGSAKFPCVMVIPIMPMHGHVQNVPLGLFPTYCFDPDLPALRISYSLGTVAMEFNRIAKVQNRFLARELLFVEGHRKILSAKVDVVEGLSQADQALKPPVDAATVGADKAELAAGITVGMLVKKLAPFYPQDAKDARVSGKVVLAATIGVDGGIHEMHVLEAPWPSLAASAMWAVSQWEYKPYLLNGEPVEVETTINVIYELGR